MIGTTHKSGFTLIELLVVVSIIAMLSSIVLASIGSARQKAQVAKFKLDLDQIGVAVQLYRDTHRGKYPPILVRSNDPAHGGTGTLAPLVAGPGDPSLLKDLSDVGLYGSPTMFIPSVIVPQAIGPGDKNGGDIGGDLGCGSPQNYLTNEYVFYFTVLTEAYQELFPRKYHGETLYSPEYRCFEFY